MHEVVIKPAPFPPSQRPKRPAEIVLKSGNARTKRYIYF
jgi:hypothetical protein